MNDKKAFLVVGGDMRQIYAAKKLSEKFVVYAAGFDCYTSNAENVIFIGHLLEMPQKADYILYPLPVSSNGVYVNAPFCENDILLTDTLSLLKDNGMIFGGKIDPSTMKIFSKIKAETVDYFNIEDFNLLNAVPTAEGAVQIAMRERTSVLYKSKVLITGFGRISKVLIKILSAMGAELTVTARKNSDLQWAEIAGCNAVHISEFINIANQFDIIFNTIPAMILDKNVLNKVKKEALIIDLASKPGGVDFEYAKALGIKTIHALALPGKIAPVTAGEIIACTAFNILKERRNIQ